MSAIGSNNHLIQATAQLPVSWYFDERVLAQEQRLPFDDGPGFVGHELMVPTVNDYRSLDWQDHASLLVRSADGVFELSNICRHRQAVILEGRGNAARIVCPMHRWTYDNRGTLLGAPHFPANPCHNLDRKSLENWRGLLFRGPRSAASNLAGMTTVRDLDFSRFKLDRVEHHQCNYNWKTFIELYLEDCHVVFFHAGLGQFVDCDQFDWQFGEWVSVQRVGITSLSEPGTSAYQRWHAAVQNIYQGEAPPQGAIWLLYYPNIMVEWYPQVLVVSTLIPTNVDKTSNVVEFYYPEEIMEFEREFVDAAQAAYMETAIEDDEIAERMDRGRLSLFRQGRNEVGPYQSPYGDGMLHFHEFYRRIVGPHIAA